MATKNEAKVVKKNQWLRVVELYAVMLGIILLAWKIYNVFSGVNKDQNHQGTNRHHNQDDDDV